MVTGSLARRYARAVLGLAEAQGSLDRVGADLRALAAAMTTSKELATVLSNPSMRRADRRRVLDALLTRIAAQAVSRNTVFLLLDGERLEHLPSISRELDAMIEAKSGKVSAEVTSAQALTPAQVTSITAALEKLAGKKVELKQRQDAALLGGVVARLGDTVYDGSLRTQLKTLQGELSR